jgi:hypothetical protein
MRDERPKTSAPVPMEVSNLRAALVVVVVGVDTGVKNTVVMM